MNRNDLKTLSNIYLESLSMDYLLLEGKEEYTNQARKFLQSYYTGISTGNQEKQYRNNPEVNKKVEYILGELKRIVDESNPASSGHPHEIQNPKFKQWGKNYEHLTALAKFYTQGATFEEIKTEYNNYASYNIDAVIKHKTALKIDKLDWNKFRDDVHQFAGPQLRSNNKKNGINIETTDYKEFPKESIVYEDDDIVVFVGTTNNLIQSIRNCKLFGQSNNWGLCISGNDSYTHYIRYRMGDQALTTYFVYFKKHDELKVEDDEGKFKYFNEAGFVIVDVIDPEEDKLNDGALFSSNKVDINADYRVKDFHDMFNQGSNQVDRRDEMMKLLEKPYQQGIFKPLPLTADEREIANIALNSQSIFDENVINKEENIVAFLAIHNSVTKGKPVSLEEYNKLANKLAKDPDLAKDIKRSLIVNAPPITRDLYDAFKNQDRNSYVAARKIKLIQGLGIKIEAGE